MPIHFGFDPTEPKLVTIVFYLLYSAIPIIWDENPGVNRPCVESSPPAFTAIFIHMYNILYVVYTRKQNVHVM